MTDAKQDKKRAATKALINIAMMEAFFFLAVVFIYLQTSNIAHLVIGIFGAMLIFGPLFFKWFKEHGAAFSEDKRANK